MKILLANIRIYGEPSAAHTHQEAPNRLAVASGGGDGCEPPNHLAEEKAGLAEVSGLFSGSKATGLLTGAIVII